MSTRTWLLLIPVLLLVGCSRGPAAPADRGSESASTTTAEASSGTHVPSDDPALPREDSAGNTPEDVLIAYVRAMNRGDWKTAYSLTAPPKAPFASKDWGSEGVIPMDDFKMHEMRIVTANKAFVRVTYSTIGFSALEELAPADDRRLVVIREPGQWWVLEKGDTEDAIWQVKGARE